MIYLNYTKCGHTPDSPQHAVGPPCGAARFFRPGRYYCPANTLRWLTKMKAMDEPCPACQQSKRWFLLTDHEGKEFWSPCVPIASRPKFK